MTARRLCRTECAKQVADVTSNIIDQLHSNPEVN